MKWLIYSEYLRSESEYLTYLLAVLSEGWRKWYQTTAVVHRIQYGIQDVPIIHVCISTCWFMKYRADKKVLCNANA